MQKIDGRTIFSATDIANFLECECIATLDLQNLETPLKKAKESDTARLIIDKGFAHEARFAEKLKRIHNSFMDLSGDSLSTEQQLDRTVDAMQSGVEIICQATFRNELFLGHADFLRKVPVESYLGDYNYEVLDTKLALKAKPKFLVQLALYSSLLAEIQGKEPEMMYVVLGDGTEQNFKYDEYSRYFRSLLERFIENVEDSSKTPYPYPCRHCDFCSWSDICKERREVDDHLSLVANITRTQMDKLEANGVTTIEALAHVNPDIRIPKLAPMTLEKLQSQAELQFKARESGENLLQILPYTNQIRGFGRLPLPTEGDLFFDMEGDPFESEGLEYLFGISSFTDKKEHFKAFWAHSRKEEKQAFEEVMDFFISHLAEFPQAHIYHYGHYEETALKKLMSLHGTREAEVDNLLRAEKLVDLYKVVREGMRISEPGYSIKNVENFYRKQREGEVTKASDSIVFYEKWLETRDDQLLQSIESYNHDDVQSTLELRNWLLEIRPEEIPWLHELSGRSVLPAIGEMSESELRLIPYREELIDSLPENRNEWTEADYIKELVFHLLDFHRRADKPAYWAMFERQTMDEADLIDDSECLAGLTFEDNSPPRPDKKSHIYTCFYPEQETKLKTGDTAVCIETQGRIGDLEIDEGQRVATFRYANKNETISPPFSIGPGGPINTKKLKEALFSFADSVIAGDDRYAAVQSILDHSPPKISGIQQGQPLIDENKEVISQCIEILGGLQESAIFIQGPPGSGKTYTGSHLIVALLKQGKRVGVSSNSHKAINNLLTAVESVAIEQNLNFTGVKKSTNGRPETEFNGTLIENVFSNDEIDFTQQLVAGTAWLFADEIMDKQLDFLFIDEAGQVALANLVAMGTSARNIILLGDQMQLGQPIQGVHPGRSGESSLEYMLDGKSTIAQDQGIFLKTTWRLHPDVCRFISDAVYDGRLEPEPANKKRELLLDANANRFLKPAGISFVPVEHSSCSQRSEEEADLVIDLVKSLLMQSYRDDRGVKHPYHLDNILIVAPYNMQVNLLKKKLPANARVGTVDKFQGQEAEVVVISMTTSSGSDLPRYISFLYSKNRLNVAISRARSLAILIANPSLMSIKCKKPEEMALVNTLCWAWMYSNEDYYQK